MGVHVYIHVQTHSHISVHNVCVFVHFVPIIYPTYTCIHILCANTFTYKCTQCMCVIAICADNPPNLDAGSLVWLVFLDLVGIFSTSN